MSQSCDNLFLTLVHLSIYSVERKQAHRGIGFACLQKIMSSPLWFVAGCCIALIVFVLDLTTRLTTTDPLLYSLAVVLSILAGTRKKLIQLALLCSVLMIAGYFLFHEDVLIPRWAFNRGLSFLILWVIVWLGDTILRVQKNLHREKTELSTSAGILESIITSRGKEDLVPQVLGMVVESLGLDLAAVHLFQENHVLHATGRGMRDRLPVGLPASSIEEMERFSDREELIEEDPGKPGRIPALLKNAGIRTVYLCPLTVRATREEESSPSGYFLLASATRERLASFESFVLHSFADQMALALESESSRRQAAFFTAYTKTMLEIDQAVIRTPSLKHVLPTMLSALAVHYEADLSCISVLEPHPGSPSLFLARLPGGEWREESPFRLSGKLRVELESDHIPVYFVIATGDNLEWTDHALSAKGMRFYYGFPLLSRGVLTGFLSILNTDRQYYPEELGYLHALANHFTAAIQHTCEQETVALLKGAIDKIPLGVTITDDSSRILLTNPAEAAMHGYESPTDLVGLEAWKLAPQDAHQEGRWIHKTGEGGWKRECWNVRQNGTTFPVQLISTAITDPAGDVIGTVTVSENITERWKKEDELRKLSAALEWSGDSVVITDARGTIEYVNQSFERVSGYSRNEVIGKNPRILKSDRHSPEYYRQMWQIILAGKAFRGEFVNRKKDGQIHSEEKTITPLRDANGIITHFVATGRDVTDRKRAEEVMRDQVTRLMEAERIARLGSWRHDVATGVTTWSEQMFEIHGLPHGIPPTLGVYEGMIYALDRDLARSRRAKFIAGRSGTLDMEYRFLRPDGALAYLRTSAVAWRDETGKPTHLLGVTQDVTSGKLADESLRQSEYRYRSLVESSPDGVFLEQDGSIVYVNPSGLALLGCLPADLSGKTLESFLQWRDEEVPGLETARACFATSLGGKITEVEHHSIPVLYQGREATQTVLRDVTETRNMQRRSQRILQLTSIGEMAATVAHEIRNPLGAIALNFHGLCEDLGLPESRSDMGQVVDDINEGIVRIQEIIKVFMDFARPVKPARQETSLHSLIENSLSVIAGQLKKRKVSLLKEYCPESPVVVVDSNQMMQVFVNLFLNALDAMPKGGNLMVETRHRGNLAEVLIKDTGHGIPQDLLASIFQPFFTTKSSGVGLGLPVVQKILHLHHSDIHVTSEPGKGTIFSIPIPCVCGKHEEKSTGH